MVWIESIDYTIIFFWSLGSKLQKSTSGLLRALVYQIISASTMLAGMLLDANPNIWPFGARDRSQLDITWTDQKLRTALRYLANQSTFPLHQCFFIDGFDELEDGYVQTLELFAELEQNPRVKLCIASRPWAVFETAFKSTPRLRLQDLTRSDIELYVEDKLNPSWLSLGGKIDSGWISIISTTIVDKADGCFLWCYLVVLTVLDGFACGDGLSELKQRLDILPTEIEGLYKILLNSIHPVHKEHAARLLKIQMEISQNNDFLDGNSSVLFVFALTAYLSNKNDLTWPIQLADRKILEECESIKNAVSTKTKGLLEIYNGSRRKTNRLRDPFSDIEDLKVKFFHKSAFDFLCDNKEILESFSKWKPSRLDRIHFMRASLQAHMLYFRAFQDIKDEHFTDEDNTDEDITDENVTGGDITNEGTTVEDNTDEDNTDEDITNENITDEDFTDENTTDGDTTDGDITEGNIRDARYRAYFLLFQRAGELIELSLGHEEALMDELCSIMHQWRSHDWYVTAEEPWAVFTTRQRGDNAWIGQDICVEDFLHHAAIHRITPFVLRRIDQVSQDRKDEVKASLLSYALLRVDSEYMYCNANNSLYTAVEMLKSGAQPNLVHKLRHGQFKTTTRFQPLPQDRGGVLTAEEEMTPWKQCLQSMLLDLTEVRWRRSDVSERAFTETGDRSAQDWMKLVAYFLDAGANANETIMISFPEPLTTPQLFKFFKGNPILYGLRGDRNYDECALFWNISALRVIQTCFEDQPGYEDLSGKFRVHGAEVSRSTPLLHVYRIDKNDFEHTMPADLLNEEELKLLERDLDRHEEGSLGFHDRWRLSTPYSATSTSESSWDSDTVDDDVPISSSRESNPQDIHSWTGKPPEEEFFGETDYDRTGSERHSLEIKVKQYNGPCPGITALIRNWEENNRPRTLRFGCFQPSFWDIL